MWDESSSGRQGAVRWWRYYTTQDLAYTAQTEKIKLCIAYTPPKLGKKPPPSLQSPYPHPLNQANSPLFPLPTAMGVMIYALIIFQTRARSIRKKTGAPYDDRLGPVSANVVIQMVGDVFCVGRAGAGGVMFGQGTGG